MHSNKKRVFRFTSSKIHRLTGKGNFKHGFDKTAITYINEKRAERSLGRSLDLGAYSQAMAWGKVMEYYCHKFHLGVEYILCSSQTEIHPDYPFWSGSQDVKTITKAGEIKCFYPKAFYELSSALIVGDLAYIKSNFQEEYYQVISNGIILGVPIAEIMAFTPTEVQLIEIRKDIEETNITEVLGMQPWETRFIWENDLDKLPYIPEGIEYPNFVKFTFEIPENDKLFLTSCVVNANKLLTE